MRFTVSLAGVSIGVESIYDEVYALCRDYLTDAAPALSVTVSTDDLAYERRKAMQEALAEGLRPVDYPLPYLETLAVYRKIAVGLLAHDTLLLHGSALSVGGEAVLFTAPSGVGKTTHTRLWLETIPGAEIVNGDKPLVRLGSRAEVCGTPWAGKEGWNRRVIVPLRAICLLERGERNEIAVCSFAEALPSLLAQVYRPGDAAALRTTLALLKTLGGLVRFYRLRCNMNPEAAAVAYRGIFG